MQNGNYEIFIAALGKHAPWTISPCPLLLRSSRLSNCSKLHNSHTRPAHLFKYWRHYLPLSPTLSLSFPLYLLINNQHARRPCHAAFATPPPCQTNTLPLKNFSVPLRRRRRVSPVPHCLPNAFPPPPSLPKLWRNFLCYLHFALKLLLFFFLLLFFLLLSLLSLFLPVCYFLLCIIYTHTNTHTGLVAAIGQRGIRITIPIWRATLATELHFDLNTCR